jgi:hypothetical protein
MDTWQIAYKILEFCKAKYSDIEWSYNYFDSHKNNYNVVAIILGSCSLFKLELEICSDEKDEFYEKEATYDYILGLLLIFQSEEKSLLPWSGSFKVNLNHNKDSELEFMIATHDEWNDDNWLLVKKARKMVREIFNFIEDEILE